MWWLNLDLNLTGSGIAWKTSTWLLRFHWQAHAHLHCCISWRTAGPDSLVFPYRLKASSSQENSSLQHQIEIAKTSSLTDRETTDSWSLRWVSHGWTTQTNPVRSFNKSPFDSLYSISSAPWENPKASSNSLEFSGSPLSAFSFEGYFLFVFVFPAPKVSLVTVS